LISGGAPKFLSGRCIDCDERDRPSLLCSVRQASLYDPSLAEPFVRAQPLQVGRLGHTSTVLADGNVLVTGGLSLPAGVQQTRVLGDIEVYNPRPERPPIDLTTALPVDDDDPIALDLTLESLLRAPGLEAETVANPGPPAKRCGDL
jgi:hypothetical protein